MLEVILGIIFVSAVLGVPLVLLSKIEREKRRRTHLSMGGADGSGTPSGDTIGAGGTPIFHHSHDHGGFPGMGDGGGHGGGGDGGGHGGGGHGGH